MSHRQHFLPTWVSECTHNASSACDWMWEVVCGCALCPSPSLAPLPPHYVKSAHGPASKARCLLQHDSKSTKGETYLARQANVFSLDLRFIHWTLDWSMNVLAWIGSLAALCAFQYFQMQGLSWQAPQTQKREGRLGKDDANLALKTDW